MISVATIADLKALPTTGISVGEVVNVRGFDIAGDGFGRDFQFRLPNQPSPAYLDGCIMQAAGGGEWHGTEAGPLHTRWAGIKPNPTPGVFDGGGFAASNLARWNAMNAFASLPVSQWLGSNVAPIILQGVVIDAGVHDMGVGTLRIGDGLWVDGAGASASIVRTQQSTNADAILIDGGAEYGANVKLSNWGLKRFSNANAIGYGLRVRGIVRGMKISDWTVCGFGANLRFEDCWEYELDNVWSQSAFRHHFDAYGDINSAMFTGCRFDDTTDTASSIAVKVDSTGGRNIAFRGCAVQRSQRIGMMLRGVRSFDLSGMQFEHNNAVDASNPDIWVESTKTVTGRIANSFFTTDGGTGRAINIRSGMPAGSVFEVSGNSLGGTPYQKFLDIGSNVAMHMHWLDRNDAPGVTSTVPGNVIEH